MNCYVSRTLFQQNFARVSDDREIRPVITLDGPGLQEEPVLRGPFERA